MKRYAFDYDARTGRASVAEHPTGPYVRLSDEVADGVTVERQLMPDVTRLLRAAEAVTVARDKLRDVAGGGPMTVEYQRARAILENALRDLELAAELAARALGGTDAKLTAALDGEKGESDGR